MKICLTLVRVQKPEFLKVSTVNSQYNTKSYAVVVQTTQESQNSVVSLTSLTSSLCNSKLLLSEKDMDSVKATASALRHFNDVRNINSYSSKCYKKHNIHKRKEKMVQR